MKHRFLLLLACSLLTLSVFAQIHDRSYGFGFSTYPSLIKPVDNNRWVVVGSTAPDLDHIRDSIFLMVLRHDGSIETKITLDVKSGDRKQADDLLVLPDGGGFVVLTTSSDCDVLGYPNMLQKIRPNGTQAWKISSPFNFIDVAPRSIHIAPDGNIMGQKSYSMVKISSATGAILETSPIALSGQSLTQIAFIPGKEDFIAVGSPDFQYWKKTPSPTGFEYQMVKSADYPALHHSGLALSPTGWLYTVATKGTVNQLARVNAALDYEALTPVQSIQQILSGPDGVYALEYDENKQENTLRKTDWLGQTLGQLIIADPRLRAGSVAIRGDSIALAGADFCGLPVPFGPWGTSYCWVRTFQGMDPAASGPVHNAAVTAVEQRSSIDTISQTWSSGPKNKIYWLEGGNFRLQITNKGDTVLQRVFANIRFPSNVYGPICLTTPARQRLYEGLNLMPGESAWVDFGDILAEGQSPLPTQLCFWTAAPNERPDQNHADDHFCHVAKFTSIIADPETPGIKLSPNPANDLLDIYAPNGFGSDGRWRLFDFTGKNTMEGAWASGQTSASLSVAHLPNGLYTLLAGQSSFKIVVQH